MKQKPASMPKLERSPSHSWWWDSHNSPKHSKWLQSNLQDLDEKLKEMLRLIEEDADSFAQRAEMYYQKRPELVNLVEAFYRAYRSLAERYDHLTGEIRQNIPRALQVQYGLSCDSPKIANANGGRYLNSPLRRNSQMFEGLLKKACQMEDQAKESDQTGDYAQGKCGRDIHIENEDQNSNDNSHRNSSDGGFSSSASDSDVDDLTPLTRLQQEFDALKEGNQTLTDSHQKALEVNTSLLTKIKELEDGYRSKNDETEALRSEVDALQVDLQHLKKTASEDAHSIILVNDAQGKELQVEILPYLEEEMDSCEEDTCGDEYTKLLKDGSMADSKHESQQSKHGSMREEQRKALIDCLHDQIAQLKQEVLERGEEKREAIRQLCFSMDVLKSNNRRLEVTLVLLKKKLNAFTNMRAARRSPGDTPAWKQLVSMGGWRAFKRSPTLATVAL